MGLYNGARTYLGLSPDSPYVDIRNTNFNEGEFTVRFPARKNPDFPFYPGVYPPTFQHGGCHNGSCSTPRSNPEPEKTVWVSPGPDGAKTCPRGTCSTPAKPTTSSPVATPAPVAAKPKPTLKKVVVFGLSERDSVPKTIERALRESKLPFDVEYVYSVHELLRMLRNVDLIIAHDDGCSELLSIPGIDHYSGKLILLGGATYDVVKNNLYLPKNAKSAVLTHHTKFNERKEAHRLSDDDVAAMCDGVPYCIYANRGDSLENPSSLTKAEIGDNFGTIMFRIAVVANALLVFEDMAKLARIMQNSLKDDINTKIY